MPTNLNAQSRYKIIDRCLSDRLKKYWTIAEINNKLLEFDIIVSKRTIEKDLETMRHDNRLAFRAPIEYCRSNAAYHYTVKEYSITNLVLTEEQLDGLYCIIAFVKGYETIEPIVDGLSVLEFLASKVMK
jgi:predicted DNA-binding transcriptional regulator YafY